MVSLDILKNYLKVDDDLQDKELTLILDAAIAYARKYTGQTPIYIEENYDISVAILAVAADMFENRQIAVKYDKVNKVIQSILDIHRINYF